MKKLFLAFLIGTICFPAFADGPELSGRAQFESINVWRGTENSTAPTVNPEFNLDWGGFNFNLWGCYAFDKSYSEFDLSLGYTLGAFTLSVSDYFYPYLNESFFKWKKGETVHQLDAQLSFEPENLPIWAKWSTIVYGDDFNYETEKQAYSSYLEAGYLKEFGTNNVFKAWAGASVGKGFYTGYTQSFSVVNLGASYEKTFEFEKVSFPVGIDLVVNPFLEKTTLVFKAAIEF